MSEEALQRVLERLNADPELRDRLENDWENVIGELGLSPTEVMALSTADEDALRRLAGAEVGAFGYYGGLDFARVFPSGDCIVQPAQPAVGADRFTTMGCGAERFTDLFTDPWRGPIG
jgi:hypothetical protein